MFHRRTGVLLVQRCKHVLLLNFSREAEQVRDFDDLRRLKARGNGLAIAPHPFCPERSCLRSRLDEHAALVEVSGGMVWRGRKSANQLQVPGEQPHPQIVRPLSGVVE